jgi:cysteine-rich repeat protein
VDLPDTDTPDVDLPDADTPDADLPDVDLPDTDTPDTDTPDVDLPDTDTPDTDTPDTGTPDTGTPDTGGPDAGCTDECEAPSFCDRGAAVTCAEDAAGCLVEVARTTCTTDGGACAVADDGTAFCDAGVCAGVRTCDPETYTPSCDGAVYLACEPNRLGCFIEQGENCSFRRGGFCDPVEGCLIDLCGDGVVDTELGEQCDDGNVTNGDGCSESCLPEPGFTCFGSPSSCERLVCGDDAVVFGEGCEDGNVRDNDGCSSDCQIELPDRGEALVIDRTITTTTVPYSPPSSDCSSGGFGTQPFDAIWAVNNTGVAQSISVSAESGAGPGVELAVFVGEWRPGQEPAGCLASSGFGFNDDVQDVSVRPGESIAIVASTFGSTGSRAVTLTISSAGCGDGRVQRALGEVCDDGGTAAGDGCSATCTLEPGFACEGEPSDCYIFGCGDGRVARDAGETCDDGNELDGDGCSSSCLEEDGALCYGEPSICVTPVCGDGVVELGEGCEDGNTRDGDGCTAECQVEIPASGDEVTIDDALDRDGTFQRPGQGPGCGSISSATTYPWEATTFRNTSDVDVSIDIRVAFSGDGYLWVYDTFFDPSAPLDRCINGNDDSGGLSNSALLGIPVPAGETVVIVVSSFSSGGGTAIGPYTLTVTTN